jgi:hypothetical protein
LFDKLLIFNRIWINKVFSILKVKKTFEIYVKFVLVCH